MKKPKPESLAAAKAAILVLAEIKSASDAFDRGEINVFDALDAIEVALDAHRIAARTAPKAA